MEKKQKPTIMWKKAGAAAMAQRFTEYIIGLVTTRSKEKKKG